MDEDVHGGGVREKVSLDLLFGGEVPHLWRWTYLHTGYDVRDPLVTDGVRAHPARSMIGVLAICRPLEFLIVRNYSPDFERRLKISHELF